MQEALQPSQRSWEPEKPGKDCRSQARDGEPSVKGRKSDSPGVLVTFGLRPRARGKERRRGPLV